MALYSTRIVFVVIGRFCFRNPQEVGRARRFLRGEGDVLSVFLALVGVLCVFDKCTLKGVTPKIMGVVYIANQSNTVLCAGGGVFTVEAFSR